MASRWEWKVKNGELPVRAIIYVQAAKRSVFDKKTGLKVCFTDHNTADKYLPTLQELDPNCGLSGHIITISHTINPKYLGSFLLEQEMIDQPCYDELQKDMDSHTNLTRKRGNDDKRAR